MKEEAQDYNLQAEDNHWWHLGRRAIIEHTLHHYLPSHPVSILECGCGGGGNLKMLAQFGEVKAFEMNPVARQKAVERGIASCENGQLPDVIPFGNERFELIGAFDVLEHVEDDSAALQQLKNRLNTGGLLVLTVPALMWLWSDWDEINQHYRRYHRQMLSQLLEQAGYQISYIGYFNFFLFPIAIGRRFFRRLRSSTHRSLNEFAAPPTWINQLLTGFFRNERWFIPCSHFPVGLSLLVIAKKI